VFPFHPGILFLSLPRSTSAVNANQKWEVEEAIQRTNELAEVDPWWMEEPTSPDDILGHARIRRVMQGAIDVCQIDSCRLARGQ
jgi:L-fuconate dehydratase